LSDGGLPLGLRSAVQHEAGRTVQLAPGSAICFYTDGLTEASHNTSDGDDMLAKVFEDANVLRRPSPAKTLKEELLGDQDPRDDVAILVVKLQGETRGKSSVVVHRWTVDVADHQAVREHRAEFKSILRGIYATTEENAISEVVLGELIGNCVRYACGVVEIALDLSGSSPVLHVLDNGPGFVHIAMLPADLYAESGRGLYIVSALTQDFRVSRRMNGGSHARAVLPLARRNILNTRPGTLAGAFTR
jgi:anti-sigma regulatory factor (Ser/Thr protein kinase)